MIIQLNREEHEGNLYYAPATDGDKFLLQHVMNESFISITADSLEKARYIAAAHGWKVEITHHNK